MTLIILILALTASLFLTRSLLRRDNKIRMRWVGVTRHIAVIIAGLFAFTIMLGMMLLLNLLEGDIFSWEAFADILQLPMIVFAVGLFVLNISITVAGKRPNTSP